MMADYSSPKHVHLVADSLISFLQQILTVVENGTF